MDARPGLHSCAASQSNGRAETPLERKQRFEVALRDAELGGPSFFLGGSVATLQSLRTAAISHDVRSALHRRSRTAVTRSGVQGRALAEQCCTPDHGMAS